MNIKIETTLSTIFINSDSVRRWHISGDKIVLFYTDNTRADILEVNNTKDIIHALSKHTTNNTADIVKLSTLLDDPTDHDHDHERSNN